MGTMRSLPRTPSTATTESSSAVFEDRYADEYDDPSDNYGDRDREAGYSADHGLDHEADHERSEDDDFTAIEASPEFIRLRRRLLLFVFPVTLLFFSWYMSYIFFAAYEHDFMSRRLFGNVTMGLVLGLAQYVSTIAITLWYVSFAKRRIDPTAKSIRERFEAAQE